MLLVFAQVGMGLMIKNKTFPWPPGMEPPDGPVEQPKSNGENCEGLDASPAVEPDPADEERSHWLGTIFTQTSNLIQMTPDDCAPFVLTTVYQIERWALAGNDRLADFFPPTATARPSTPPQGPAKKPLARMLIAKVPSLQTPAAFGRWMYRAISLRHRLLICSRVILAMPHPSFPQQIPLPASYFFEKYDIADDTLRKAREAGRIRGEKPHGRWLYYEDEVRRKFASAVAEAEERRKQKEGSGIRPKGKRQL